MKKLLSETCDSIVKVDTQWDFAYDGDGSRVKQVVSTYDPDTQSITGVAVTAYFMGGLFEVNDNKVTKYYSIAGMTVAMYSDNSMKYLLTDQLGSVVAVTNASGALLSQQRYLPFGQVRTDVGTVSETDFGYTGQRAVGNLGLMDYHARMYDAALGRFVQPDSIVPSAVDPQTWDRYSYVGNNPIDYNDPTGNCRDGERPHHCKARLAMKAGITRNSDTHPINWGVTPINGEALGSGYSSCSSITIACLIGGTNFTGGDISTSGITLNTIGSSNGISVDVPNDFIDNLIGKGLRTPEIKFVNIDLGFWIISGSYQIGASRNASGAGSIYNNGFKLGPFDYQANDIAYSNKQEGFPGIRFGINEPTYSVDTYSKVDLGNYEVEQRFSVNMELRWERAATVGVLLAGPEALFWLLGQLATNPRSIPIPGLGD